MNDVNQNCRLCLQRISRGKRTLISDDNFQRMLRAVFSFKVLPAEGYPEEVCRSCTALVENFSTYSDKVRSNQELIQSERSLSSEMHTCYIPTPEFEMLEVCLNENIDEHKQVFPIYKEDTEEVKIEENEKNLPLPSEELETDVFAECFPAAKVECLDGEDGENVQQLETECSSSTSAKKTAYSEADERLRDSFHLGCDMCPFLAQKFRELFIHYRKAHNTAGYVRCCNRKFPRRARALEHADAHKGAIRCHVCQKTFTTYFNRNAHMVSSHGDPEAKKYKCSHCDKTFLYAGPLRAHEANHLKVRCKICDKKLSTSNSLKSHLEKIHGTQTKHICAMCGKELNTKVAMDKHMNAHLGIEAYEKVQCDQCQKWFNGPHRLAMHLRRLHLENGPSQCDMCDHVSPNQYSLKNHKKRMHLLEKLFKCHLCGKQFKTKLNLREHVATHTGIPLYDCEFCSVTFKSNANRYTHIKARHPLEWLSQKQLNNSQKTGRKLNI